LGIRHSSLGIRHFFSGYFVVRYCLAFVCGLNECPAQPTADRQTFCFSFNSSKDQDLTSATGILGFKCRGKTGVACEASAATRSSVVGDFPSFGIYHVY
jgi:hypothetical protein